VGESFDPAFIVPSFQRMVSVRLIVERTIIVIVPLFALFVLDAVLLLALIFNPIACVSVADNVAQVFVILISSLAALL
jgi:hypothetical protein